MADNVTLPASGTGDLNPKAATEQVATTLEHKQLVELAIPGTGRTLVPADVANGLDVDVTRVTGIVHVDDNAGSLTVDGTVTANAGTGPFPVSDNAGSLTVDAPVGTPAAVRLSDGAAFFDPRDVSDRAVREVGRTRLWDGIDEATVLPRGTVPTSSDKGLCVVALNQARPSYQVVTNNIVSGTAVAITRPLSLWHPATLAKDVFIIEIGANVGVPFTTGRLDFELQFISAESATGTVRTAQPLDLSLAVSGMSCRELPTADTPTGAMIQRASQSYNPAATATPQTLNYDGVVLFRCKDLDDYSDAIRLRSGVAEGLIIRHNILVILGVAMNYNIYARYIERA